MEEEQNIPNCQNGDNNTLPAGTLKISPEQNIESISPLIQHKKDTDTEVPEGWKLGKNVSPDVKEQKNIKQRAKLK